MARKRWDRLPVAALVVAVASTVTIAATGANQPVEGLDFAQAGHWVANHDLDVAFHVNGGSKSVDAKAPLAIDPGDRVYQGDTSAYVVGDSRIREFGESTLEVERTIETPTGERPVGVEAAGGPYLVYREAGTIVRLGAEPATIQAGKGLGNPVVTPDGTLWLHRQSSGVLCRLAEASDQLSCPLTTERGHSGALSVVGEQPVFVDTTEDTVRPVSGDEFGDPVNIGSDIPTNVEVGSADAGGRIPMLDRDNHRLHLVDGRGLGESAEPRPASPPASVALPDGDYEKPEASGDSVVLLDREGQTVRTYGPDGTEQGVTPVPEETGDPRLTRGEDARVYVDGDKGGHVMVVDEGGETTQIPLVGDEDAKDKREDGPKAPPPDRRREERDQRRTGNPPQSTPDRQVDSDEPPPSSPQPPPPEQPSPPAPPPEQPAPPDTPEAPAPPETPQPPPSPPKPPPPPPPAPASPPGAPVNLIARPDVGGDSAQLSWGAAPSNGAPVTGYHVSWRPVTGAGTVAKPAGARNHVLSGLASGVVYTVTVVAENKGGRGAAATATVQLPKQTITISQGEATEYEGCGPPCHEIRIVATGLNPGESYEFNPFSNHPTWRNEGTGATADENGNVDIENIKFGDPGYYVWVKIAETDLVSNRYLWPEG